MAGYAAAIDKTEKAYRMLRAVSLLSERSSSDDFRQA